MTGSRNVYDIKLIKISQLARKAYIWKQMYIIYNSNDITTNYSSACHH